MPPGGGRLHTRISVPVGVMGRRNRRADDYVPLDVTPVDLIQTRSTRTDAERFEVERQRAERQREARSRQGIDWSVCIVPGCGGSLIMYGKVRNRRDRRDPSLELPICYTHAAVIWNELASLHTRQGDFIDAIADVNQRLAEREVREREESKARRQAREDGEIYYIRLNGLVKVGWSRDFYVRLRAYGPDVEVLCHYEGTRSDETNLHRQLRPALARGREWYHDGDIIRLFLNRALEQHGPPSITAYDWTSPAQVVASKRATRRR